MSTLVAAGVGGALSDPSPDRAAVDRAVVMLKRRATCEVATVDSPLLTEVLLDNILASVGPAETAALQSSLVCKDREVAHAPGEGPSLGEGGGRLRLLRHPSSMAPVSAVRVRAPQKRSGQLYAIRRRPMSNALYGGSGRCTCSEASTRRSKWRRHSPMTAAAGGVVAVTAADA